MHKEEVNQKLRVKPRETHPSSAEPRNTCVDQKQRFIFVQDLCFIVTHVAKANELLDGPNAAITNYHIYTGLNSKNF